MGQPVKRSLWLGKRPVYLLCIYTFTKDRKDGYGGVLIAVRRNLIYELVPTDGTCELIAVKITCQHNSVVAASIYRPTNNDTEYAAHLATAMENLAKKHSKDVIWIGEIALVNQLHH